MGHHGTETKKEKNLEIKKKKKIKTKEEDDSEMMEQNHAMYSGCSFIELKMDSHLVICNTRYEYNMPEEEYLFVVITCSLEALLSQCQ